MRVRSLLPAMAVMLAAAGPAVMGPAVEDQFIQEISRFAGSAATAPNDMARGALRRQRAADLCSDVGLIASKGTVANWTGIVTVLDTTDDNKGILEIHITDQIAIGTSNNRLSDSLLDTPTLLAPNSTVYNTAISLTKGQKVRFSGSFLPSKTDCAQETSLTVSGSLTEPSFLFRFTALAAAP